MNEWIDQQLDAWVSAKRIKDFAVADRIRDELRAEGIEPDKARPAPLPPHVISREGNNRPDGRYNDFASPRGPGPGPGPGPGLGPSPVGRFGAPPPPPGPLAAQNDPQFLEHLDQLMHRQNQMEAQLIQMQAQLQATNDIMEQQQQLLASAGLTPLSRAPQAAAPAPAALPAEPITRPNGQSVSLAPPPSNDTLLTDLGAPPLPPMPHMPPLGSGAMGAPPLPMGAPPPGMSMDGGLMGAPLDAALQPPLPAGAPPPGMLGGSVCGKRGVDAAGF